MIYVLMNQSGRYLQPDNTTGAAGTAIRFARYVDAFNSAPRGFRVIERAA